MMRSVALPLSLPVSLILGLAAALGSGCGVDENLYNAAVKDRDSQKQKLAETQTALETEKAQHRKEVDARDARVAVLTKKLESLGQDVSRLETERGTLGGELEGAKKRMEELRKAQAQAEERAAQFRKLVSQFKQLTDAGKLQVELRENRMIVRLGDQILFDPGKTELKKEGEDALRQVTDVLKAIPNRNFQVAGHTDNVPIKTEQYPSNWELASARALTVVRAMTDSGLAANRVSAASFADTKPAAPNDTAEGKAQNRRIEIVLMPNLDELPDLSALESTTGPTPTPAPPSTPAK